MTRTRVSNSEGRVHLDYSTVPFCRGSDDTSASGLEYYSSSHARWEIGGSTNGPEPQEWATLDPNHCPSPAPPRDGLGRAVYEHFRYVRGLAQTRDGEQLITAALAEEALRVWEKLYGAGSFELAIPDASPGPDGQLLYVWDRGDHYLSLEMSPGQIPEFFYRNRATGEIWGVDYGRSQDVPNEVKDKLGYFLAQDWQ